MPGRAALRSCPAPFVAITVLREPQYNGFRQPWNLLLGERLSCRSGVRPTASCALFQHPKSTIYTVRRTPMCAFDTERLHGFVGCERLCRNLIRRMGSNGELLRCLGQPAPVLFCLLVLQVSHRDAASF